MRPNLTKPIIAIGAAIIIAGAFAVYGFFFYSKPVLKTTVAAQVMDLSQTVSAPGTVTAAQDLSLAFQRGGEVASLIGDVGTPVRAGEAIAGVSSSDLEAQLEQAQAALTTQQIMLEALEASTTSTTGTTVEVGINNAQTVLLTTLVNNYQSLDGTLASDVDNLFDNARTDPVFTSSVSEPNGSTYFVNATPVQTNQLDSDRQTVNAIMASWSAANAAAQSSETVATVTAADSAAESAISDIQGLLTDLTNALSSAVAADATGQALFNSYRANINTARTTVAGDLTALRAGENATTQANTPVGQYDVSLQQAAVANAQAAVDGIKTQIAEGTITSPIDGVITEEDVKVGEIASANAPALEVISNGQLQMDAYVSEADISSIQVGQSAMVTLDSGGSSGTQDASSVADQPVGTSTLSFAATVISIDPAETVVNGTNSYKVTLQFNQASPLIKSGMTGNVDIQIAEDANALAVPTSAIISNNGQDSVFVQDQAGTVTEVSVTTGIVDATTGWTEVTSGLQAGDQVVTFGN